MPPVMSSDSAGVPKLGVCGVFWNGIGPRLLAGPESVLLIPDQRGRKSKHRCDREAHPRECLRLECRYMELCVGRVHSESSRWNRCRPTEPRRRCAALCFVARHFGCRSDAGEIDPQLGCGAAKGRQQTILRAEDPGTGWEVAIADAEGFFCDFYFESGEPVPRRGLKPSWPVSFRRDIGPEPETLPAGCGSSLRS